MNEFKHISSIQNPLVKKVLLLRDKSRERKKTGFFILEGKRELAFAIKTGYFIETMLYCEDLIKVSAIVNLDKESTVENIVSISHEVYKKMAYRDSTEGVLAVVKEKPHKLSNIKLGNNPLILVAEAPEKPGNIGALLRTADAANLDAVLIANPKTDLYNPNIIRSSVGCVFTQKIAMGSSEEIIQFLKEKNISIYCAALTASKTYTKVNYEGAAAIIVGTEDRGLSIEWLKNATQNIIIPMGGKIDSMNVSVSAAILIFEAKRQRNEV